MQYPVAVIICILINSADDKINGIICPVPLGSIDMPFPVFRFIPGKNTERMIFHDHFQFTVKIFFPVKGLIELFYDHKKILPFPIYTVMYLSAKNIANMKSERITLIFSFLILIRKNMIHFIRYLSFINFKNTKQNF